MNNKLWNTKSTATYDVRNSRPCFGQAQTCGEVKQQYN